MKNIPRKEQNPNGLHQRFYLQKIDGTKVKEDFFGNTYHVPNLKEVDSKAEYFVLRLDLYGSDPNHIMACRKAIHTYAENIKGFLPELASDLKNKYPILDSNIQRCLNKKCQAFATNFYGDLHVCDSCYESLNNEFDEEYR